MSEREKERRLFEKWSSLLLNPVVGLFLYSINNYNYIRFFMGGFGWDMDEVRVKKHLL